MYSLLNYIAATSKETSEHSMGVHLHNTDGSSDYITLHSVESGLRGLPDEDKRLIGISTISVATRLALEFQEDEVLRSITPFPL
jgi:phosphatidylinositol 4-kinase A